MSQPELRLEALSSTQRRTLSHAGGFRLRTKLVLVALAHLGTALASPTRADENECPGSRDLTAGLVFSGGLDDATLTVTPVPEDWVESMGLADDPDLDEYRFLELSYPIESRRVHQSESIVSYKGLIEFGFSRHVIYASVEYQDSPKTLFPLTRNRPSKRAFKWRSPLFEQFNNQVNGSLELNLNEETTINIGSCEYTVQILNLNSKIEIENPEGIDRIVDHSTVYYLPELQAPFAILHAPADGEAWIEGMFDTVERLAPGSDASGR